MSLDRSRLRDELVAVISAGRELSPEYDYLLADAFLDASYRRPNPRSRFLELLGDSQRMRNLIGAACLVLAALAFSVVAFHGDSSGAAMNQPAFVPRSFDPDDFYGGHSRWHHDGSWDQDFQSPWAPSTSPSPGS